MRELEYIQQHTQSVCTTCTVEELCNKYKHAVVSEYDYHTMNSIPSIHMAYHWTQCLSNTHLQYNN